MFRQRNGDGRRWVEEGRGDPREMADRNELSPADSHERCEIAAPRLVVPFLLIGSERLGRQIDLSRARVERDDLRPIRERATLLLARAAAVSPFLARLPSDRRS